MILKDLDSIPTLPGVYALHLRLASPQLLVIGRLGALFFQPGDYIYIGSAMGTGGLRARLGRHLRGPLHCHWHIDYLRQAAHPVGFWHAAVMPGQERPYPVECTWVWNLKALPGAALPFPGFGSSDCPAGCGSHLLLFPLLTNPQPIEWPAEVKW